MKKVGLFSILSALLFCLGVTTEAHAATTVSDREYWIQTLTQIADPVLNNMSRGKLRKNMPVETVSGVQNPPNTKTTHLEALGRLLCGMAPWLELGPDKTSEGKLRKHYINLMCKSISHGFDPDSPDFLNFTLTRQPLVDAAFFCQGLLRAPKQIWANLDEKTRSNVIKQMRVIGQIKPVESNWLLFASMVETAMFEFTGEWNRERVDYATMRFKEWYKGDGWYGDGEQLHMDYYNSYVIHPMLLDMLKVMQRHNLGEQELFLQEQQRFTRHAEQQERFISPDGAYPVIGRSIVYRFGAFQVLAQAAYESRLPTGMIPAQVRSALTAVIHRHMEVEGDFDADGWLTLGFCGHQPELAERYISTGSLYLCSAVFLPLGLDAKSEFWSGPYTEWSGKRNWQGDPKATLDKALK